MNFAELPNDLFIEDKELTFPDEEHTAPSNVVLVRKKTAFGVTNYWPENDLARGLVAIMPRRETLRKEELDTLKNLGFKIELVKETYE